MERPDLEENPFVGNTREVEEPEKTEGGDSSITRQALGFVPGVGTALDVADVARDVERGDYVGAGIGAAATAVGAVPFVGRFLGKGVKALAQSFRKLPKADETKDVLDSIGVDEKVLDGWRAANKTDDAFKKRLVGRQTELEEIAKKYKDNPTDEVLDEYRLKVDELNPIKKIEEMPELPTDLDVRGALGIKVDNLAGKRTGLVGVNRNIKEGTRVASRLDINGYTEYNKWIATLTVPKAKIKEFVKNNPNLSPTSYARAVHLKNVDLKQSESLQKKSLDIASGRAKGPHAVMEGDFLANDPKDVYDYAKEIFEQKPKEWVQVGYNPIRAGFFYERGTGLPIESAEEIIQVGPLVLAKNVVGGSIRDYFFNKGGDVMEKQMEMAFMNEGGVLKDDGMNKDPVSGNEVPSGSMAKEVRDDIPAQLSEGEYVVPADVVRFHGVQKFEDLRNQAKKGFGAMEADGRIGGQPVDDDFPIPVDQLQTYDEGGDVDTYEQTFGQPFEAGQRYGSTLAPKGQGFELVTYTSPDGERTIVIPHYNGKPMSAVPTGFTEGGGRSDVGTGVADPMADERDRQEREAELARATGTGQPATDMSVLQDQSEPLTKPVEEYDAGDYINFYKDSQDGGLDTLLRNTPVIGGVLGLQYRNIRDDAANKLRSGQLGDIDQTQFQDILNFVTTPQTAAGMLGFGRKEEQPNKDLLEYTIEKYRQNRLNAPEPSTVVLDDLLKNRARQNLGMEDVDRYIDDIGKDSLFKGNLAKTATKLMLGIRKDKDGNPVINTKEKGKDTPVTPEILKSLDNNVKVHEKIEQNIQKEDENRMSRGEGPMSVQERFDRHHEQFTGFTSSGDFVPGLRQEVSSAPQNIGGGGAFPTYDFDRGGAQNRGGLIGKPKTKKRTTKKGLGVKTKAT